MKWLPIAMLLTACDPPPLKIVYDLEVGPNGPSCNLDGDPITCEDVPMQCDAVLSLRIVSPSDLAAPYLSVCEAVPPNGRRNLCAISSIDLPVKEFPKETMEVQVLVWPREDVTDPVTGELNCQLNPVTFSASGGFPEGVKPPAFGGHAFWHPGDEEVRVFLGCTDIAAVNQDSCKGAGTTTVSSTVIDFETRVPVSVDQANRLTVSVGEPTPTGTGFELSSSAQRPLPRTVVGPPPVWSNDVDLQFDSSACIAVLEDEAQATVSLACQQEIVGADAIDIQGVRLAKSTLQQVLTAMKATVFPPEGLTIGMVVDEQLNPAANFTVTSTAGTVEYLSADRRGLIDTTATTQSGMFVSRNAPYGTDFTTGGGVFNVVTKRGGIVAGKVTVVLLQLSKPPIGN
jgi:hypothetical protein